MERKLNGPLKILSLNELEPGDVLLSRGCDAIADMITTLDGSRYSHASIWCGEGKVAEAVSTGLHHWPLSESLNKHCRGYTHVYRATHSAPARLSVAQAAQRFTEGKPPYAWGDLLLAGLLALIKPIPTTVAREKLKLGFAQFQQLLERRIPELRQGMRLGNPDCMTCSQLVALAFTEAVSETGQPVPLRLTISGDQWVRGEAPLRGSRGADADTDELAEWRARIAELAQPLLDTQIKGPTSLQELDPLRDSVVYVAYTPHAYPPHLVSPRDLFSSPDLEPIGRLDLPALEFKNCTELMGTGDTNADSV